MSTDRESKGPAEEKKSPFKDDAALKTGTGEQEEAASSEEESEAEQMRKEALTERD